VRNGILYRAQTDHLGRPEALVTNDASSTTVWRSLLLAFDRQVITNQIGGYNLGFPGQYHDEETGFIQNNYRDYDPATGKYLQVDPIGLRGGVNPYGYVRSNPVGLADIFTTLDIDITPFVGVEINFGFVFDTDTWLDSGYYFSAAISQGGNYGVGVGAGIALRDIEGKGACLDMNLARVSPAFMIDDKGMNGGAFTLGRGRGVSGSSGYTWTASPNALFRYLQQ